MQSPSPGMDPYLEQPAIWSDLHLTLIIAMRAELNAHLPQGYLAAAYRHAWRTPYLKIVDAQDRRVITVVEMLSPTNKTPGKDRNAYLAKREEYSAANVNLVEINLLRAGSLRRWESRCRQKGRITISSAGPTKFRKASCGPLRCAIRCRRRRSRYVAGNRQRSTCVPASRGLTRRRVIRRKSTKLSRRSRSCTRRMRGGPSSC
jgi:Protein of unknown function (DUF4058)